MRAEHFFEKYKRLNSKAGQQTQESTERPSKGVTDENDKKGAAAVRHFERKNPRAASFWRTVPFHHKDPFDRLLVAHSQLEYLKPVTKDANIFLYGVAAFWQRV